MIMIPYHYIGFLNILYENVLQYVFLSDYVSQFLSNFPKTPFSNYSRGQLCMDAAEISVSGDKPKKNYLHKE